MHKGFGPDTSLFPKIFGIGMFKTATTSLRAAFMELGFKTNGNYWALFEELSPLFDLDGTSFQPHHAVVYRKALEARAFCDSPWLFLYQQLDAWFPGSRFILTLRDPDAVAASDLNMWRKGSLWERWIRETGHAPTLDLIKSRYEEHVHRVRRYFAGREDLLEIDLTIHPRPWHALCDFLEIPRVPDVPFPHMNKGSYAAPGNAT